MSQSGVSVRTMSHKHESYESEWSKCENGRKESVCSVNRNITPLLNLKFLLKV